MGHLKKKRLKALLSWQISLMLLNLQAVQIVVLLRFFKISSSMLFRQEPWKLYIALGKIMTGENNIKHLIRYQFLGRETQLRPSRLTAQRLSVSVGGWQPIHPLSQWAKKLNLIATVGTEGGTQTSGPAFLGSTTLITYLKKKKNPSPSFPH